MTKQQGRKEEDHGASQQEALDGITIFLGRQQVLHTKKKCSVPFEIVYFLKS
jgi:hypothetical protein